jgi:hypothetical protein
MESAEGRFFAVQRRNLEMVTPSVVSDIGDLDLSIETFWDNLKSALDLCNFRSTPRPLKLSSLSGS